MNKLAILLGLIIFCAGCATERVAPVPKAVVVVAPPKAEIINMPASSPPLVKYPKNAIVRQKPLAAIEVYPGSLKENIQRIAAHYGWHQVVWDAPQDYRWFGYAQIQGENLSSVLRQLLADYPLQAVFYQGNHVLYIHPRTLK
jgi:Toxin co-regulated pilus biosynthesis protein Q